MIVIVCCGMIEISPHPKMPILDKMPSKVIPKFKSATRKKGANTKNSIKAKAGAIETAATEEPRFAFMPQSYIIATMVLLLALKCLTYHSHMRGDSGVLSNT